MLPALVALVLAMQPERAAIPSDNQNICGTVIDLPCDASATLLTLLVQPGVSAKILASSPAEARQMRMDLSLAREERVCATGVLAQHQDAVTTATFVVSAAADVVPQAGGTGDWPTADVYSACDTGFRAGNVRTFSRPTYTKDAMKAQIQGAAWVQAIVGVTGQVERARLVKSLDAEHGLDEEALKTAKQWTFTPATRDGTPVRTQVMLELTFTLRK